MAIYRGAGGAGDAVNDAASEALLTIEAKDAALAAQAAAEAAQAAAEAAQAAAETAQAAAETAETNAETAETNAETAETNAELAETNAETAATNAANSASAASTSATNASNSASAASTSATNAANSASAAATSATNAANSATTASTAATNAQTAETNAETAQAAAEAAQLAAETAETNAETAETNAETAATNASNSASAASTSATNASNSASSASTSATNASSSASAAATSASNAATSATNASNSASAAATSATNASNSASAAATSATAAANAQTAAETARDQTLTAYDNFDDRYLGAKTSDPSLDNDGNALVAGALYFNSSAGTMKVYTGSTWVDAYAAGTAFLAKASNLSDLADASTARTNLGVAIGTNVQAWDGDLDAIAALSGTSGLLKKTAANTWSLDTSSYLTSAVTSVTATAPIASSGGATPDISITQATTSTNGYLSSIDWNTFNNKQAALTSGTNIKSVNSTSLLGSGNLDVGTVTSVAATAGTGISISGSPITGSGTLTITNTAPDQTVALTAGTGISTSGTYPNFTITNSAPDQTVALTGAGTTSITGTYPNFTITSNDQYTGTVTSVTGTSPVASSGGATPAISLSSGYGDTQNPYASKTANFFLAAPNGTSGVPTFRAIVAADIPTLNQNTTGSAASVSGTTSNGFGTRTVSTSAPTGGNNGDIWYKV